MPINCKPRLRANLSFEPRCYGKRGARLSSNVRGLKVTTEADFNRLSIAVRDFEKAIMFSEEALRHPYGALAYEALVFTSIVSYYRPFSPNEKDKKNPLASSLLKIEEFASLTREELAIHEKCRELRNQALAHSAYKYNPTRLDASLGVVASRPFSLLSHAPELTALMALAKKLADECHHKRANYMRNRRLERFRPGELPR